jgi:hypothetical protein
MDKYKLNNEAIVAWKVIENSFIQLMLNKSR